MTQHPVRSHHTPRSTTPRRRIALGAAVCLLVVPACADGSDDDTATDDTAGSTTDADSVPETTSTPPSSSSPTAPSTNRSPTTATTAATTTTAPPTSTPTTTTTTTTTTATTAATTTTSTGPTATSSTTSTTVAPRVRDGFGPAPDDVLTVSIDVPSGDLVAAPGDYVALRTDGDLEYHPNGLAPTPGNRARPITLVERADPRQDSAEGPGPNVIDDVAGIVDGSLIYGDCCEPVSGTVWAADEAGGEVGPVAIGFVPGISPSGDQLAIINDMQLSVFDLSTGRGKAIAFDDGPDDEYRSYQDLQWLDDETFAVITDDGDRHQIVRYDAGTLAASLGRLNLGVNVELPVVRFTGLTPEGFLTVSTEGPSGVTVLYLAPGSLEEVGELQQNFPPTVRRIETDDGGLGQLWVDGGTLYHRPPATIAADPLLDDVRAAWFLTP